MKRSQKEIDVRREEILAILQDGHTHTTEDLAQKCAVSVVTMRRDLALLDQRGLLTRMHGSAQIREKVNQTTQAFSDKAALYQREKKLIAAYIARIVPVSGMIFCNSGTTVYEVVRQCREKQITIITNNEAICRDFCDAKCEIIATGGEYSALSQSFVGDYATQILQKTFADICILGVNGVSAEYGVTTFSSREPMITDTMIHRCRGKVIVAATGHKIGKVYSFTSAQMSSIDLLVTDSSADPTELKRIQACGVEIVLADRL